MLTKIGERLADKTEMIVPRSLLLRSLMANLSRMTVKRSTDNASSWCCTQQFKFPGMTELDVVYEDDTDDFDELDAGAAVPSVTIVCDMLSQGSFLSSTGWCRSCAFFTPRCISQELDVSSATFARLVRRKEGCRYIVIKVRVQTVIGSKWSSAAVMFPNSDCLIINETAVVNAHPVQNINREFTECSIGTDGDIPG